MFLESIVSRLELPFALSGPDRSRIFFGRHSEAKLPATRDDIGTYIRAEIDNVSCGSALC